MMTNKILHKLLNIKVKNLFIFGLLTSIVYIVFIGRPFSHLTTYEMDYEIVFEIMLKYVFAVFCFCLIIFIFCILFFAKPNYHYVNLLIKRIERFCHQYKTDKNDRDIDDIITNIIYEINYKLKNNSDTIGFWLCNKNHYKGKLVKGYLDFVESSFIRKAIKTLDKKERHLQEYREQQKKQKFKENKEKEIDKEICQNIDLWFGGVR